MKNCIFVCLLLISGMVFSQEYGAIQGQITDAESYEEPLLFANIGLKNTSVNVQSNFHGNFEITDIAPGSYTLVISYLGYESEEIPVIVEANKALIIQESLRAKRISTEDLVYN